MGELPPIRDVYPWQFSTAVGNLRIGWSPLILFQHANALNTDETLQTRTTSVENGLQTHLVKSYSVDAPIDVGITVLHENSAVNLGRYR